jgi:hypothetical protein
MDGNDGHVENGEKSLELNQSDTVELSINA